MFGPLLEVLGNEIFPLLQSDYSTAEKDLTTRKFFPDIELRLFFS